MAKTALIILAAGNSSRLGASKQLLVLNNGLSLLAQVVSEGIKSKASKPIVVLGANYEQHKKHLHQYKDKIDILHHANWQKGMGSTIKRGLKHIQTKSEKVAHVILSVCDQPYLDHSVFNALIQRAHDSPKTIIASRYDAENFGVPVLFKNSMFGILSRIPDESGALVLLKQNIEQVDKIDFEKGIYDIDTSEDWQNVIKP